MNCSDPGFVFRSAATLPQDAASRSVFLNYTQEQLDRAYDQSAWAPQMAELEARDGEASAAIRQRMPPRTEQYGPSEAQLVDIFAPAEARDAAVLVFIHGGAWKRNSRRDVSYPASTLVERSGRVAGQKNAIGVSAEARAIAHSPCQYAPTVFHQFGKPSGLQASEIGSQIQRAAASRGVPKILEPRRRQLGVAHRVLVVAVAQVRLKRARIVAPISKRVPASVPEHVRVALERHLGHLASPLDHSGEAGGGERRAALRREHE
jgi:hypothetical protein